MTSNRCAGDKWAMESSTNLHADSQSSIAAPDACSMYTTRCPGNVTPAKETLLPPLPIGVVAATKQPVSKSVIIARRNSLHERYKKPRLGGSILISHARHGAGAGRGAVSGGGAQGRRRIRPACGHRSSDAAHDNKLRPPMEEVKRISGDSRGAMPIVPTPCLADAMPASPRSEFTRRGGRSRR